MEEKIEEIRNRAESEIKNCADLKSLEDLKVKYLGRRGELILILRSLADLSLEEKKILGPEAQTLRNQLDIFIENKKKELSEKKKSFSDISRPGKKVKIGHLHPLSLVEKEIIDAFRAMNFSVVDGPEVETDYYNFDALNIPKNHPARDMWDTFWLKTRINADQNADKRGNASVNPRGNQHKPALLLRTHTSPMQIRYMEKRNPPFQIIVPGKVFRYEATDASHEVNFHQVEGLMVSDDINLANFKHVIKEFFSRLFKKKIEIRMRPSFFPFVEPGLEVDIQCVKCGGKGCNICKESGWLEIMGAGMVHPNVFKAVGYNPKDYQGFAFGLGLERIAMLKYNIPDIRMFYSGNLRFINQF